ncbi:LysR substrate-binding domain-containing protein [Rhodoblastus sp. 17X3]|uniref:LysR substrate-binding domain-containing protein n=1 Tax=Rhodoblastus sp. 17X3 TaxID=3047026 RepID=UPI0024B667CB|nr:LysR substrate-binding domain-containing protein [Rhodoblastus sp. 17X3]MDI9849801.1 LysR substrate-binding domain-containing protein [Rhodoblastus sp. 17X3]
MSINLHLLRMFVAVVEHGGFSPAALTLNVSQSAVSKGVKELEGQLGGSLLERRAGMRPTETGAVLLRHAQRLFAAERSAEEELRALQGLTQGELRLGASTTVATYMLPPLLGAFHAAHPQIRIRLTSENTRQIADRLLAREVDIAVVEGPVDDPEIDANAWRIDDMALIAAPGHPLAAQIGPIDPVALAKMTLLVREPGSGTREVVAAALEQAGVHPGETIEIGSTEAIKQLVASGFGVAIVSLAASQDQIALGALKPVEMAGLAISRPIHRLRVTGRPLAPAAAEFERMLYGEAPLTRTRRTNR